MYGPKANREKMTQVMFETFNSPAVYIDIQAKLSLLACGIETGVAVECGSNVTYIAPVYEGYILPHAVQRLDVAGSDVTDVLINMIGQPVITEKDHLTINDIKETICYVALDVDEEIKKFDCRKSLENTYELSNGQRLVVGKERFLCPETLFKPAYVGLECEGIIENIFNSIMKCDVDIRKDLYSNIVLSGGSAMFSGIADRVKKDIIALAPSSTKVAILFPPVPKYGAWIGGSKQASSESFQKKWITKQEYDDAGPSIVHRKCF